ncbi:MAG: IS21 family transposase [Desulfobacterales bacterium]|nr:MAG: IS21 family transposase [Desulfobacterales bacterium]
MRKIREVLRLKFDCNCTYSQIAESCLIGRSTVSDYLARFYAAKLSWPLPADLDDDRLEHLLFPSSAPNPATERITPDWSYIHRELRRKAVTLMLLWQEYKEQHPDGYQYSQFCHWYRQWAGRIDPVMRQEHRAGEKMFVDYAGMTVPVFDADTGSWQEAQIFVAALGASNYTYAEATRSQTLADWIASHCRAFSFFGGVTEVLVPDNTKTGVKHPCFYEPDINPTYLDMARHYDTVIIPARVKKPKDKAKVETAVQIVERWILAPLRNHTFFSLGQLNESIRALLDKLNSRPFQKLPGSRQSLFEHLDRPALKPLPQQPYQFAEWKKARVNLDYHIEVDRHYYSVPHPLLRKQLDVRITDTTIECFYKNKSVASHIRSHRKGRHTTVKEHMPPSHQKWADWTPDRFIRWAEKIGPNTSRLIDKLLSSRPHPQQAFRSAMGILRLAKDYGDQRLEAACTRALIIGGVSYRSVASILKHSLDQKPLGRNSEDPPAIIHVNIRGNKYYH